MGIYVVLVEGEALSNHQRGTYPRAYQNSLQLAEGLSPIIEAGNQLILVYDNLPHIGFVLYRSAVSSHLLDPIPIDIAIGDSQGAIGSFLANGMRNMIIKHGFHRHVTSMLTSVVVKNGDSLESHPLKAIGPSFDLERAQHYEQILDWKIIEDPGHGYRRAFYIMPALEILEMEEINELVAKGSVVICGGVGIPYFRQDNGELMKVNELVETESTALLIAKNVQASHLWMVVDNRLSFLIDNIDIEERHELCMNNLERFIVEKKEDSTQYRSKLSVVINFLHDSGREVMICTNRKLKEATAGTSGLIIR